MKIDFDTLIISGHTKISIAFAAGVLMGLNRLGVLHQINVMRSIGVGNILLGFFHRALLLSQSQNRDMNLQDDFLTFIVDFCHQPVEATCIKNRIMKPWCWLRPWQDEIRYYLWKQCRLPPPQPVSYFRLEYVSKPVRQRTQEEGEDNDDTLLCVSVTDTRISTQRHLDPSVVTNVREEKEEEQVSSIAHLICRPSCVDTDPFGFPPFHQRQLVIECLPPRKTLRHRDKPVYGIISAIYNPDLQRLRSDLDSTVVDFMEQLSQIYCHPSEVPTYESIPFPMIHHACNWGYVLTFKRLTRKVPPSLLFTQSDDMYSMLDIFK